MINPVATERAKHIGYQPELFRGVTCIDIHSGKVEPVGDLNCTDQRGTVERPGDSGHGHAVDIGGHAEL